jgi:hypothetical protein
MARLPAIVVRYVRQKLYEFKMLLLLAANAMGFPMGGSGLAVA